MRFLLSEAGLSVRPRLPHWVRIFCSTALAVTASWPRGGKATVAISPARFGRIPLYQAGP